MPDGMPVASRDAPVGGQAVLEGVMMRGVSTWAVAVPASPTARSRSRSEPLVSWAKRHRVLAWPVIRGVVALAESLRIGFRALGDLGERADRARGRRGERADRRLHVGPDDRPVAGAGHRPVLRDAGRGHEPDQGPARLLACCSGSSRACLRTAIFIGYLAAISRARDLRRVFEYHGAEHKTISCYEAGDRPDARRRAERYSRLHPRCGTSFLLVVMVVAIFVFAPLGLPAWYWLRRCRESWASR